MRHRSAGDRREVPVRSPNGKLPWEVSVGRRRMLLAPFRLGQFAVSHSMIRLHDFSWERMVAAVDAVRERACRITAALDRAGVPYAVVGGNAVAAWVARIDAEAVRNTKDVDVLIRRDDLSRVVQVAASVGFVHHNVAGVDLLVDGPAGSVRSGVHLVFAKEHVRPEHPLPAPDVTDAESAPDSPPKGAPEVQRESQSAFKVVSLDGLVRMKLNAYRLQDRVHLLDLRSVGLIDESWCDRVPPELAQRLRDVFAAGDAES